MREKQELGKIIFLARKKKKITQQEFAKMLNVSDKAISNWETGKNYPDLVILNDICNILGLNISELLIDKKNNMNLTKKILLSVTSFILVILFSFLLTYFINNYNKFKVYEIELDSDKYKLNSSYLIISNNNYLINMGNLNVQSEDIIPQFNIKIYQDFNNQKKDIIGKNKYSGITFSNPIDDKEHEKDFFNNLYMEINYKNGNNELVQEFAKIKLNKIYASNKLTYSKLNDDTPYNESQLILLKNNGYVKSDNDNYIKYKITNDEELFFTYNISNKILYLEKENEKLKQNLKYDVKNNLITLKLKDEKEKIIEEFNYNTNSEETSCVIGKCITKDLYINEVLSEYKKITTNNL